MGARSRSARLGRIPVGDPAAERSHASVSRAWSARSRSRSPRRHRRPRTAKRTDTKLPPACERRSSAGRLAAAPTNARQRQRKRRSRPRQHQRSPTHNQLAAARSSPARAYRHDRTCLQSAIHRPTRTTAPPSQPRPPEQPPRPGSSGPPPTVAAPSGGDYALGTRDGPDERSAPDQAPAVQRAESPPKHQVINGMISKATIFATLIIGLIAGPAVSLYGSPTVSPVTAAAWASEPLPP